MLAVVRQGDFHGIVGTPTGTVVNGVEVCVGDIVKVAKGRNNSECTNLVAIFGNKIGVMGIASNPISQYDVVEIVQSHKELTEGSKINDGYFKVKEFQK